MRERISALLIHQRPSAFGGLHLMLESSGIQVNTAHTCGDALLRLWSESPPHLVFTEAQLLDGIWADVLSMTRKSRLPVNVIVVSRIADVNLYVQVLERGGFDFIVPPFEVSELEHIIRCATDNILAQRLRQQAGAMATIEAVPENSTSREEESLIDDDLQAAPTL